MNKVERAIIMAAGLGKRMQPLTLKTPKPLICINGEPMIESIIKALQQNGIEEIHIVVGYLKEQFDYLKEKYKVDLIENPYFNKYNNISSLFVARDYIENSIILDGDQIVKNPDILKKEFELSGYNAVWTETDTDEWLMQVEDGVVKSCSRNGGKRGWQLFSVSRWTKEDGNKLKHDLEKEFLENGNTDIYWDDVAMFCHFENYKLGIYEMNKNDIVEVDSIKELSEIDSTYKKYL